jgi:hypothetical protein
LASQGTYDPEHDEDTIELELTAEEMRGLSQAAQEHFSPTAEPAVVQPPAVTTSSPPARRKRLRLWPIVLVVALLGIAAAFAWLPRVPQRAARPPAQLPVVRTVSPVAVAVAAPAPPAQPQAPSVRVKNPFDPQEVFEFPAGTTRAEARQKVSQLLLQRAIDRGDPASYRSSAGKAPANEN